MRRTSKSRPRARARVSGETEEQDRRLLEHIRQVLAGRRDVTEKKMFGGVAFMVNGHMCCGSLRGSLVLRLGEDRTKIALAEPHVEPMGFTGKALKTMVYVRPQALQSVHDVKRWVTEAVGFATLQSPKMTKRPKKKLDKR